MVPTAQLTRKITLIGEFQHPHWRQSAGVATQGTGIATNRRVDKDTENGLCWIDEKHCTLFKREPSDAGDDPCHSARRAVEVGLYPCDNGRPTSADRSRFFCFVAVLIFRSMHRMDHARVYDHPFPMWPVGSILWDSPGRAGRRSPSGSSNRRGSRFGASPGLPHPFPMDASRNTAGAPVLAMLKHAGTRFGIEIDIHKGLAPGSGIGSSAASAVAAVVATDALLGTGFSRENLLEFALEGEKIASGGSPRR